MTARDASAVPRPPPVQVGPLWCDFRRPLVMGIINLSPDSFSDGGEVTSPDEAVARARALASAGADIVDLGGVSTRPGHPAVSAAREAARVLPAVAAVARAGVPAAIGVDTARADIARRALAAGAHLVNDQRAGEDPDMARVVAEARSTWVLMHGLAARRRHHLPPPGAHNEDVDDPAGEVVRFLTARVDAARALGVARRHLWVDIGLGFHKQSQDNWALLRALPRVARMGLCVVVGASRKRFIGEEIGEPEPQARDVASAAVAALAVSRGAHVIRAHHVPATRQAVAVARAMVAA